MYYPGTLLYAPTSQDHPFSLAARALCPNLPGPSVQSGSSCFTLSTRYPGRVKLALGMVSLSYTNPAQATTSSGLCRAATDTQNYCYYLFRWPHVSAGSSIQLGQSQSPSQWNCPGIQRPLSHRKSPKPYRKLREMTKKWSCFSISNLDIFI